MIQLACSCPILRAYRTNNDPVLFALVRFFAVIGQTMRSSRRLRLSDSSRPFFCLFIYVRADESDKDRHQQYDRE
jgi:hypothetical protein